MGTDVEQYKVPVFSKCLIILKCAYWKVLNVENFTMNGQ